MCGNSPRNSPKMGRAIYKLHAQVIFRNLPWTSTRNAIIPMFVEHFTAIISFFCNTLIFPANWRDLVVARVLFPLASYAVLVVACIGVIVTWLLFRRKVRCSPMLVALQATLHSFTIHNKDKDVAPVIVNVYTTGSLNVTAGVSIMKARPQSS